MRIALWSQPAYGLCGTGFDDERGDYVLLMHDHVSYRYEVIMVLGKGSFGQVYTPARA